ncbi:RNA polymerase sigma factor [Paenibacillus macerans]|uniref:RNA polymerase sigma factor n=1 Tax=Paenibacillus macerans TaxID=44252 RepID=UPI00204064AE|nr:RNA polymerase sigma factor [Paenibacillus macerans]MCM3703372.1 RNA polymerase sigma factor [Paenibacillus macerans]
MDELKKIYERYFQDVYRFALSLSRSKQMAEEITQETFFKALKNIDQFKGTCKMNVWLCQIAKNTYFTFMEKQQRFEQGGEREPVAEGSIEQGLVNKAEALRIHKLLHELDEPYKEVFTLRVFGELSFDHISQIFGRTESWARVTFHRAKQKIQRLWMEDER